MPDPAAIEHVDLTVVMPVYNEEASLGACGQSWADTLDGLGIDYRLLIVNDGSKDSTPDVLADLAESVEARLGRVEGAAEVRVSAASRVKELVVDDPLALPGEEAAGFLEGGLDEDLGHIGP